MRRLAACGALVAALAPASCTTVIHQTKVIEVPEKAKATTTTMAAPTAATAGSQPPSTTTTQTRTASSAGRTTTTSSQKKSAITTTTAPRATDGTTTSVPTATTTTTTAPKPTTTTTFPAKVTATLSASSNPAASGAPITFTVSLSNYTGGNFPTFSVGDPTGEGPFCSSGSDLAHPYQCTFGGQRLDNFGPVPPGVYQEFARVTIVVNGQSEVLPDTEPIQLVIN